jgi:hypothetical protein
MKARLMRFIGVVNVAGYCMPLVPVANSEPPRD